MKNNKNLSFAISLALCLSANIGTRSAQAAPSTGIIHYHNDQSIVEDDSDLVLAAQLLLNPQSQVQQARQPVQLPTYVHASNQVSPARQYRPPAVRQAVRVAVAPSPRARPAAPRHVRNVAPRPQVVQAAVVQATRPPVATR